MGPASDDKVAELIEEMSHHRDRCLPQRGDRPKFATNAEAGQYVNEGYRCIADNVHGGILDLIPVKGAKFLHRDWEIVDTCIPRNVSRHDATWALSCIQSDLRHRLVRVAGTKFFDNRNTVRLQNIIRCDEGGSVQIDDLIRMEVLRDEDQRKGVYNERLRLLFDGNYLNAKQHRGEGSACRASQSWTSVFRHACVEGGPDRRVAVQSQNQERESMDRAM